MTTAPGLAIFPRYGSGTASRPQALAFWRGLIVCSLFSVVFLPEFIRDGTSNPGLSAYAKAVGGFRFVDLAILFVVFCHLLAHGCLRGKVLRFPRPLALPGCAFLACVAIAVGYGRSRGGSNVFFDWRGLALGIGLYIVWSFWLQTSADVAAVIRLVAVYMAIRIALLFLLFAAGHRDNLLGVSIPIFDGPVLSCIVFAALLAFGYQETAVKPMEKLFWCFLAVSACLMILLCFRRTYWAELALGTFLIFLLQMRNRLRNILLIAGTVAVAGSILGASFSSRMQSFDVTRDDSEFSADNADHLYDLMDAWYQVRQSPVMGIGLGTSYPTWHIKNWKAESVMVHNAPLHVWLKYGFAGLLCYLWFHLALLRWLYKRLKGALPRNRALVRAAFAYLTAQFVITLGFAPWPYSELQLTTLTSFILAAVVAANRAPSNPRHEQEAQVRLLVQHRS